MAAAKKKTTGSPTAASAAGGEPIGRWAQVLAKAQETPGLVIEPFEVYDGLTLYPMTPARSKKYADAQLAYFSAVAASANIAKHGGTQDEVDAIVKQRDEALQAYNEALIGQREFPLVEAYFADKNSELKDLFMNAIRQQFLRLPDDGVCMVCNRNGVCPHCQKHDTDAVQSPGEGEGESSTTSSTTGTSSTGTSPDTSTG